MRYSIAFWLSVSFICTLVLVLNSNHAASIDSIAYVTHNVTLGETVTNREAVTVFQWYGYDEFSRFVLQLLIPTTVTTVCAAIIASYAARRDALFAAKVGIAVLIIVPSSILFVVVGLSQTIIPILRGLNAPFSAESAVYSAIIATLLLVGLGYLWRLLLRSRLRIGKIEMISEEFNAQIGYRLNAFVESHSKSLVYDLSASVLIVGPALQLLHVERYDNNQHSTVKCSTESYKESSYGWSVTDSGTIRLGKWPELREGDKLILVYPHEEIALGFVSGTAHYGSEGRFMSSEKYLYLRSGARYKIRVEVKGVDASKNTVSVRKTISKRIPD